MKSNSAFWQLILLANEFEETHPKNDSLHLRGNVYPLVSGQMHSL